MNPQNTPVDARTLTRVDAIADFVKAELTLETPADVVDTLHAFLILYAMNAKLVGMAKEDAGRWFSEQWDDIHVDGEVVRLSQMPCSATRH